MIIRKILLNLTVRYRIFLSIWILGSNNVDPTRSWFPYTALEYCITTDRTLGGISTFYRPNSAYCGQYKTGGRCWSIVVFTNPYCIRWISAMYSQECKSVTNKIGHVYFIHFCAYSIQGIIVFRTGTLLYLYHSLACHFRSSSFSPFINNILPSIYALSSSCFPFSVFSFLLKNHFFFLSIPLYLFTSIVSLAII